MPTITVNVSGRRFEMTEGTYSSLAGRLPPGSVTDKNASETEPFFERHADVFQSILHYYQTGSLHLPLNVCPQLFTNELKFWGVEIEALDKCCYNDYGTFDDDQKCLHRYQKYSERPVLEVPSSGRNRYRMLIWTTLTDPFYSTTARVYFWCSFLVVLVSIIVLSFGTHPIILEGSRWGEIPGWLQDYLIRHYGSEIYNSTNGLVKKEYAKFSRLFVVEMACTVFFTAEVVLKLATCPTFKVFFLSFINAIDLLSVLPMYLWLFLDLCVRNGRFILWAEQLLELAAILRVCRLFRLARRIRGLRVIMFALVSSAYDLFLLTLMLCIATVVFSSVMYYVDTFPSILHGFWWAIITMTTVGYGDMYPKTALGMIVGSLCAMTGVLIVALTVPIFVNRFLLYYTYVEKPKSNDLSKPRFAENDT